MIVVDLRGEKREVPVDRIKVEKLLLRLGLNPEDVLVIKDGRLLTEDRWLKDGDEVQIWEVVSRG